MTTQRPNVQNPRIPKYPVQRRPSQNIPDQKSNLDPLLQVADVVVEQEELLEPDEVEIKGKPTRLKILKYRLGQYGNRVLVSGRNLVTALSETAAHIVTALAGSILLLPVVILVRGIYVLLNTVFSMIKPLVLSLFRAIFDLLRGIIWPLHEAFMGFNKRVLFPLLKRIKEDDTAALAAFGMLVVIIAAAFVVLNMIF